MLSGTPDCEPGRVDREVGRRRGGRRSARGRSPSPASPSVHVVACWRGEVVGRDWPAALAWASSIHGRKSAGARSGNVRQRLVRSPFGSMSSAGSPARRTSSISTTPRPVLPEPVMPTMTPWVVRSAVVEPHVVAGPLVRGRVDEAPEEQLSHARQRSERARGYGRRHWRSTGFPAAAFEFYEGLEADNTKVFWQANKATFETARQGADGGAVRRARARTAGDRSTCSGRTTTCASPRTARRTRPPRARIGETEGGAGHYVHLGADGLLAGAGYYSMAKDQLERFRAAVDDEHTGAEVAEIVAGLAAAGYSIGAMDELKSAPRGYPKDHPRIELLRRKGLMASRRGRSPAGCTRRRRRPRCARRWPGARRCARGSTPTSGRARCPPTTPGALSRSRRSAVRLTECQA